MVEVTRRGRPPVIEVFEMLRAEPRAGLFGRCDPAREILDGDVLEAHLAGPCDMERHRTERAGRAVDRDRTPAAIHVGPEHVHVHDDFNAVPVVLAIRRIGGRREHRDERRRTRAAATRTAAAAPTPRAAAGAGRARWWGRRSKPRLTAGTARQRFAAGDAALCIHRDGRRGSLVTGDDRVDALGGIRSFLGANHDSGRALPRRTCTRRPPGRPDSRSRGAASRRPARWACR